MASILDAVRYALKARDVSLLTSFAQMMDDAARTTLTEALKEFMPRDIGKNGKVNVRTKGTYEGNLDMAVSLIVARLKGADSGNLKGSGLAAKLRRIRTDVTKSKEYIYGHDLEVAFMNFCKKYATLIDRAEKPQLGYWLDDTEKSESVRAVSAGIPDSNRRRH